MIDIFEEINKKFNITKTIIKLSSLITNENYCGKTSFEKIFEGEFWGIWEPSLNYFSLLEMKKDLQLVTYDDENNLLPFFVSKDKVEICKYLQYSYNIVMHYYCNSFNHFGQVFTEMYNKFTKLFFYILKNLNLKVEISQAGYYILVPINSQIERAIQIHNNSDDAVLIYEYSAACLIHDLKRKEEILKLLASSIEPIIQANKGEKIAENLSFMLNNFCIRHNNLDNRKSSHYFKELEKFKEEDWNNVYDMTFDLIITLIMLDRYNKDIKSKVEILKKQRSSSSKD